MGEKSSFRFHNKKLISRWGAGVLLAGFLLGSFLPSFVQAAPSERNSVACTDPVITKWEFTGDTTTPASGIGTFSFGSDILGPDYYSGPTSSESPAISFSGWNSGAFNADDYIELHIDTTGRQGIRLSFDTRETGTGPSSLEVYYSTDGINFSQLGSVISLWNTSSWHLLEFDFSAETSLDDQTDLYFRLYAYGGSSPSGTWRLDNITVSSNCGFNPLDVIINEIAWAGTEAYFGDEWVELYNPSTTQTVLLDGWVLTNADGSFYISFDSSDQIAPDSYFLIERGSGNATSAAEDKTYTSGELNDSGETLYLFDDTRQTIDTANANSTAWSHGRLSPASSMERINSTVDTDNNWVTNDSRHPSIKDAAGNLVYGTPGEANWGNGVSYTPTPTNTFTPVPTNTPIPSPTPTSPASLTLLINEVAWGGTNASSSHEWIELYNPSLTEVIDLTGWRLTDSGDIDIALSGVIQADGYFLLEQTENTVDDVPSDLLYNGTLSNSGEYLKLISPSGNIIDTANNDSGAWPAGSGSPSYASMERSGVVADSASAWLTHAGTGNGTDADGDPINGTPRQPNWAYSVTPTVAPTATRTPIPATRTPTSYPFQSVVLNEVLPRPGHDWNEDGAVDVNDEFIEIINRGTSSVSLSGWYLQNLESSYRLPDVSLGAGQRLALYRYTTYIALSDGGSTVRLLKNSGQIADVLTYTVVKEADQAWCRLPENGFWRTDCFPTPNEENAAVGDLPALAGNNARSSCLVPDTAPAEILLIECGLLGMDIYATDFWAAENRPVHWVTGQTKYPVWFR